MRLKNNFCNFYSTLSLHILNSLIFLFLAVSIITCHKTKHQNYCLKLLRETKLDSRDEFLLGSLCYISGIAPNGDYIISDLVTPQVLVFDSSGHGKTKIGGRGDGPGEFRSPKSLIYYNNFFYLYDNVLLRISLYDTNYCFRNSFSITLPIEEIKITSTGCFFGYKSVALSAALHHVWKFNDKEEILSFGRQSKNFSSPAASEGGGILCIDDYLYFITPYEYMVSKFDLNGKLIKKVSGKSAHYTPLSKKHDEGVISSSLHGLKQFHDTWSHIRQIIQIDKMIGIVYAEAGESHVFLDLYDFDLHLIVSDILIPNYVGRVFSQGGKIYLLQQTETYTNGQLPNPSVVEYLLKLK